ncbi:MAG: hypothetical protein ACFE85_14735 [Candidatus Hodarchaeota archaeon]
MSDKGFEPLTDYLGISGTSYIVQIGEINRKWAVLLLRGNEIIECHIFNEIGENEFPNKEDIIKWILNTIILKVNTYQVQRTVNILIEQAKVNKIKKKVLMSLKDAKEVELEKVPQPELKRSQSKSCVIDNQTIKEEEKKVIFCPFCGLEIKKCPRCGGSLSS